MNKLDLDYQALLQDILDNGVRKNDRTGTGTLSVFGRQIRHKMSEGFPLLTTKKMYFKGIVTELLWFLRGDTNIKYLVDNDCHIWNGDAYKNWSKYYTEKNNGIEPWPMDVWLERFKTDDEFAKKWGELGPIYGKQWRNWRKANGIGYSGAITMDGTRTNNEPQVTYGSIDQIKNLINDLKASPDSRRLMVNAWNVGELDQMVLPPCHFSWQCYSHEQDGKRYLSLAWSQRSVDCGLGLPFNIASYGLLLEIIAKTVDMIPYELIGNLGDCHIYNNHIDGVKQQLERSAFKLPKLKHLRSDDKYKLLGEFPSLWNELKISDFELENYQSYPPIKLPLSN